MAGRLLCFPRQLGLSQVPTPFHSDYSWDRPELKDRRRLLRGMRQKKVVAYAVLGFVCPFRDVTKPETTDPTSRLLVGEGERWDGWARQRLASPRIATSPSLRVTFKKCSLPRVRATLHEARGSRDPRAAAANHRNGEIFPHSQECLCASQG